MSSHAKNYQIAFPFQNKASYQVMKKKSLSDLMCQMYILLQSN